VKVVARDGASTPASFNITIKVTDVDEVPPEITSSDKATVDENVAAGTTVYTAVATDASTPIAYSLEGDDRSAFEINSETGEVKIKASPDFESGKTNYSFTVTATDPLGNGADKTVTLSINDLNEPTTFSGKIEDFTPPGQVAVGKLTANDGDGLASNPYAIKPNKGGSKGTATINTSGEWAYVANEDAEPGLDFFTVTATDTKGTVTTQQVDIYISDNSKNNPPLVAGGTYGEGEEDHPISTQLSVIDPEDTLAFSITTGPANGTASFKEDTSNWTYKPNKDFFGDDSFVVTVTGDQSGEAPLVQTIKIKVLPMRPARSLSIVILSEP